MFDGTLMPSLESLSSAVELTHVLVDDGGKRRSCEESRMIKPTGPYNSYVLS